MRPSVSSAGTTMTGATDNQAFCYDEPDRLTWAGSAGTLGRDPALRDQPCPGGT